MTTTNALFKSYIKDMPDILNSKKEVADFCKNFWIEQKNNIKEPKKNNKLDKNGNVKEKKAPNAYNLFIKNKYSEIKSQNPEMDKTKIFEELAKLWNAQKLNAKEDPKADAKEDTKAEAKAEAKEDPKAEAKEDTKAEAKEDAKAEAKEDTKAEAKEDTKADAKEDPKAEAKSSVIDPSDIFAEIEENKPKKKTQTRTSKK